MKIKLKNTPEQIELIKAMASPDANKAMQARQALADFIGPVIQEVLNLEALSRTLYVDWPYNEDDEPSFPLDQFYGVGVDQVAVWQQDSAGGLGTSLVTGLKELKLDTYNLSSAVSLLIRNIQRGRLPYVSLALNRMAQEVLAKQERNAFLIALRAAGEAETNGLKHVISSTIANVLQLDDFNRLMTRSKRINTAFNGGTPDRMYSKGATDMIMSPEMMEQIRGFAYQPMNTRTVDGSAGTPAGSSTAMPLPDSVRDQIYRSGGESEIYGINLHEALEFGVNQAYNAIFGEYEQGITAGGGGGNFAPGTDECVLAIDLTREALIRPVAQNAATGAQFVVEVDDQFTKRSGKVGWFGGVTEGAVCVDSRCLSGLSI